MAQPTIPLETWALGDYILPISHNNNKVRPINDLWDKGYDKSQKPAAEEWNYVWNMATLWLSYVTGEQIPGLDSRFLMQSKNLSDLSNVATARNNLVVYSKTEADTKFVDVTGDTMTGPLNLQRINFTGLSTDYAFIQAVSTVADTTYLDFVIGDNAGAVTDPNVDFMRWRFANTAGTQTSMMELNSLDGTNAYLRVFGQIWGRQLTVAGNVSWSGTATGNNLNITGSASAASLLVGSESATVAGKNIVRSVNNITADGNGNITLPLATTTFNAGSPGWWRDNSTGMIIQWGYGSWKGYNNETYDTVAFPIAFPNTCLLVSTGTQYQTESVKVDCWGAVAGWDTTMARLQMQWSGENEWETGARCTYIAIGY